MGPFERRMAIILLGVQFYMIRSCVGVLPVRAQRPAAPAKRHIEERTRVIKSTTKDPKFLKQCFRADAFPIDDLLYGCL